MQKLNPSQPSKSCENSGEREEEQVSRFSVKGLQMARKEKLGAA